MTENERRFWRWVARHDAALAREQERHDEYMAADTAEEVHALAPRWHRSWRLVLYCLDRITYWREVIAPIPTYTATKTPTNQEAHS